MTKQITAVYVADHTRVKDGEDTRYFFGIHGSRGREYGSVGPWSEDPTLDGRSARKLERAIVEKVGTNDIEIKLQ